MRLVFRSIPPPRASRPLSAVVVAAALLVGLAPSAAGIAAAGPAAGPGGVTQLIVRLAGAPALTSAQGITSRNAGTRARAVRQVRQRIAGLRAEHQAVRQRFASAGLHVIIRRDFTQVINAVAVTVPAPQAARLAHVAGVTGVYPDTAMRASTDEDVSLIGAPQVWQANDPSGRADQGDGQIIAVVDTGIDYNDPDLGAGFGPGYKVVAGYNFVANSPDPMDDNGHGTHVAGIIAGDPASPGGRTGVAPKANLTAYKVLNSYGYGRESTVIAGLEAAVSATNPYRAGVVNLSLSGPPAASDPLEQACEDAIQAGAVVVAAAGNDGPGESTVGSPAEAPGVLAVGASISGISVPTVTVTSPVQHQLSASRLGLSADPPAGGEDLSLVDVGKGQPGDYTGLDVTGKAVLMAYKGSSLDQQLLTAEQEGAAAVLLSTPNYYSYAGGQPGPLPEFAAGIPDDPDKLGIVATVINGTDATDIQQWLSQGPVQIHIGASDATDQIAAFSAHGPALGSYDLKPDLVAPGVEIGSTWLGGDYRDESGTSMAAPHAAGAAALLRQAHPGWAASQVDAALTGGAHLLSGYDGVTQGAGRLDVAAADQMGILPSPRIANMGLADLSQPTLHGSATVTLTNVSSQPQQAHITVQQAAGPAAQVSALPAGGLIAPGDSVSIQLSLTGQQPGRATDFTGWLRASVQDGTTVTVPYLLAVRPLVLHAVPDPAPSGSTVYIHSEAALAAAPAVRITEPGAGQPVTATASFYQTGWWRVSVPAGPAGAYLVSASAPSVAGPALTGATTAQELATPAGASEWQSVGPDSEGAWQFAFSSQPARMYAMPPSPHAGLFRTDDSGASWQELRSLPVGDGVDMGVAADPTQAGAVYLAVEGAGRDPTYQGEILASADAGRTWTALPFPDVAPESLSIDSTGRILTVPASNGYVYVSVDRGQTWTAYRAPGGHAQQARVIGHDLYIASGSSLAVIRNIDGTPSEPQQIFTAPDGWDSISDVTGDGNILLADTFQEVFASRDGGATWQPLFTPPHTDPAITSIQIVNGDIYVGGNSDIWVDAAEGSNWVTMPAPAGGHALTVGSWGATSKELVVFTPWTGIFTTSDHGVSYRRIGLAGATVRSLAVTENSTGQPALVAGTDQSDFSTPLPDSASVTAATRDWGITGHENGKGKRVTSLSADPANPQIAYQAVTRPFGGFEIDQSTDGGATWDAVAGIGFWAGGQAFQVVDDPANPQDVYVALTDALSPGLLVSRDGGQTWRKNQLPALAVAIAADPQNPNHLWLGGPSGLYVTNDQGQTVTQLSKTPVTSLAVDPADPQHLIVGGNGLWVSRDGGQTLTQAQAGDYRYHIAALLFGPGGKIYAAADASSDADGLPAGRLPVGGRGVLVSNDGGRVWSNISGTLPDLDVASLAISPGGHWLYAGTEGGSVYRIGTG